jgi:hypothetical protein
MIDPGSQGRVAGESYAQKLPSSPGVSNDQDSIAGGAEPI